MSQKGFAFIYPLIAGAIIVIGVVIGIPYLKAPKAPDNSFNNIVSNQSTASPSASIQPSAGTKVNENKCDAQKDICFESDNLQADITEGNQEDEYYWITDQLKLTGKGSGGFKLSLDGFPKEFTVRSPVQEFKDGTLQKFYVRAQKEVAKKGTYSGKISVNSYLSGNTTTANLTINYTGGESSVHTDPKELVYDCKVILDSWPGNQYINCGAERYVKFYAYYGGPKKVEVRNTRETGAKRALALRTGDLSTVFEARNITTLHIDLKDIPSGGELTNEPTATYKGVFVFVEQETQKELLRTPYVLNITNSR